MEDKLKWAMLFSLYGDLLTEHQKEIFELYYVCDLSLGEIAEIKTLSRQGVNDVLRKAKEQLAEFDVKLGFSKKLKDTYNLISLMEGGEITLADAEADEWLSFRD